MSWFSITVMVVPCIPLSRGYCFCCALMTQISSENIACALLYREIFEGRLERITYTFGVRSYRSNTRDFQGSLNIYDLTFCQYCKPNFLSSMSIRGHCIYWAIPENNPSWILNISKMAFKESLYKRMKNVVWRYKSR